MTSITASGVEVPARQSMDQLYDRIAYVTLALVASVALLTFRAYGLGWDDYTHAEYADLLLKMFGSGFKDTSALSFANLYMYGGGFDMAAALLHKVVPLGLFDTRRLVGAIVGIIGLALTWRLTRRVGGPLAGLAALLLLALCPTFYGHMFMNPKDVPFAVAMIVLLLGLVRLAQEYPAPSPHTVLILGLGAGLSLGCRVLGGFGVVYALIGFIPIWRMEVATYGWRKSGSRFVHTCYVLLPGLLIGYIVMGLIWPWSIIEPANPLRALTYFSAFFEKPWKELFNGAVVSVPEMPWSYLPTLFAMQMPEVFLLLCGGGLVMTIMALTHRSDDPRRKAIIIMIASAAFLPLAIAMVKRPALYNGIRHFIFVIPPMAMLGGLALARFVAWVSADGRHRDRQFAVVGLFAAGLTLPLIDMARLHPYQYTHFNYISGTVRTADHRFMLDYWGLALKQASNMLREQIILRQEIPPANRKWKVAVCGPQRPAQVALGPNFSIGWDSHSADFAMTLGEFYCKGLPAPIYAEVKRDDVVFARVYDIRGQSIASLLAVPPP